MEKFSLQSKYCSPLSKGVPIGRGISELTMRTLEILSLRLGGSSSFKKGALLFFVFAPLFRRGGRGRF